jgi:hypothetical protein
LSLSFQSFCVLFSKRASSKSETSSHVLDLITIRRASRHKKMRQYLQQIHGLGSLLWVVVLLAKPVSFKLHQSGKKTEDHQLGTFFIRFES